ncbi:hypothetical protein [Candidatus Methanarcanum hacksteinii]|uniref:hypothetical protein n=1 Tax=Candidatus Methanarcanum hacksteinii TaxID=2911857 RepID=UPI0037DDDD5D
MGSRNLDGSVSFAKGILRNATRKFNKFVDSALSTYEESTGKKLRHEGDGVHLAGGPEFCMEIKRHTVEAEVAEVTPVNVPLQTTVVAEVSVTQIPEAVPENIVAECPNNVFVYEEIGPVVSVEPVANGVPVVEQTPVVMDVLKDIPENIAVECPVDMPIHEGIEPVVPVVEEVEIQASVVPEVSVAEISEVVPENIVAECPIDASSYESVEPIAPVVEEIEVQETIVPEAPVMAISEVVPENVVAECLVDSPVHEKIESIAPAVEEAPLQMAEVPVAEVVPEDVVAECPIDAPVYEVVEPIAPIVEEVEIQESIIPEAIPEEIAVESSSDVFENECSEPIAHVEPVVEEVPLIEQVPVVANDCLLVMVTDVGEIEEASFVEESEPIVADEMDHMGEVEIVEEQVSDLTCVKEEAFSNYGAPSGETTFDEEFSIVSIPSTFQEVATSSMAESMPSFHHDFEQETVEIDDGVDFDDMYEDIVAECIVNDVMPKLVPEVYEEKFVPEYVISSIDEPVLESTIVEVPVKFIPEYVISEIEEPKVESTVVDVPVKFVPEYVITNIEEPIAESTIVNVPAKIIPECAVSEIEEPMVEPAVADVSEPVIEAQPFVNPVTTTAVFRFAFASTSMPGKTGFSFQLGKKNKVNEFINGPGQ